LRLKLDYRVIHGDQVPKEAFVKVTKKLLVVAPIAATALLVFSSTAALAAGPGLTLHRRIGPSGFLPFGLAGGLAGLLLLAGFVLLIIWLIRALVRPAPWRPGSATSPAAPPDSPLEILSRRFAAGEITADEFKNARDVLRETTNP
jgi:putative membrane protein